MPNSKLTPELIAKLEEAYVNVVDEFLFESYGVDRARSRDAHRFLFVEGLSAEETAQRVGKFKPSYFKNHFRWLRKLRDGRECGEKVSDEVLAHLLRPHWTDVLPYHAARYCVDRPDLFEETEARQVASRPGFALELAKTPELGTAYRAYILHALGMTLPRYTPPPPMQSTLDKYAQVLRRNGYTVTKNLVDKE